MLFKKGVSIGFGFIFIKSSRLVVVSLVLLRFINGNCNIVEEIRENIMFVILKSRLGFRRKIVMYRGSSCFVVEYGLFLWVLVFLGDGFVLEGCEIL